MMTSLIVASITGLLAYFYRTLAMPAMTYAYNVEHKMSLSRGITLFEIVSILCSMTLVWYFSIKQSILPIIWALIFTWGLLMLSYIDCYYLMIPNFITGPLWLLGILANITSGCFASSMQSALLGSYIAYSSLWLITTAYWLLTRRIGLGGGDIKLFGVLGAWLGIEALPFVLWIASSTGLCSAITWLLLSKKDYHTPIPFGPFLAVAGFIYLLGYKTL